MPNLYCSLLTDTSKVDGEFQSFPKAGMFLASLASLSTLTITSHHYAHNVYATLITHQSNPAARLVPAPLHHALAHRAHGTKVTVRDLFSALPVRAKHRILSRELYSVRQKDWHSLRHAVTAVLLAWNRPVSITIRTSDNTQKAHFGKSPRLASKNMRPADLPTTSSFDLDMLRHILIQGGQCDADSWDTWCTMSARTPTLTIRAIISKQPAPSKYCQFISFGNLAMEDDSRCNILYDEVNRIFASSSFGVDEELRFEEGEQVKNRKKLRFENDDYTYKELRGRGKGIDRWPMFYVRIEPYQSSELSSLRSNDGSPEGGKALQLIIEVFYSLMTRFLSEHHYRVSAKRNRPKDSNHRNSESESMAEANTKDKSKRKANFNDATLSKAYESPKRGMKHRDNVPSSKASQNQLLNPQKKVDLQSAIALPKPPRKGDRSFRNEVWGWSRVKTAQVNELSVSTNVPPHTNSTLMIEQDAGECTKNALSPPGATISLSSPTVPMTRVVPVSESMPSDAESIGLADCPNFSTHCPNALNKGTSKSEEANPSASTIADTDDSLKWTNPLTKAQVMINRRTGLLMADPHVPAAAASPTESPSKLICDLSTKRCKILHANTESSRLPALGTWTHELLCSWDNPIFNRNEDNIKQISLSTFSEESWKILSGRHPRCTHHDIEKTFSESSAAFSAKISISDLADSIILGQLDKKFILVKVNATIPMKHHVDSACRNHMLVLVDQHAADERFGVEALFAGLCSPPSLQSYELQSIDGLRSAIETTALTKPITISVNAREGELFKECAKHFAAWGILLDVLPPSRGRISPPAAPITVKVQIRSLPPSIVERCRSDIKHLTELLREEVWRMDELGPQVMAAPDPVKENDEFANWAHRIRTCPPGILNMLNSRACRSAIMFNDELTLEECEVLIRRLAQCHFPFQCAHGRPTMIPLVDIGTGEDESRENDGVRLGRSLFASDRGENESQFVDAWRSWGARKMVDDADDRQK